VTGLQKLDQFTSSNPKGHATDYQGIHMFEYQINHGKTRTKNSQVVAQQLKDNAEVPLKVEVINAPNNMMLIPWIMLCVELE
jgi:hypothetical protein